MSQRLSQTEQAHTLQGKTTTSGEPCWMAENLHRCIGRFWGEHFEVGAGIWKDEPVLLACLQS